MAPTTHFAVTGFRAPALAFVVCSRENGYTFTSLPKKGMCLFKKKSGRTTCTVLMCLCVVDGDERLAVYDDDDDGIAQQEERNSDNSVVHLRMCRSVCVHA